MSQHASTARSEWRTMWPLPIAAMFGYSLTSLHVYGLGPFIEPLQQEFGWTRARISFGVTIASLFGMLFSIFIGLLIDRIGSRRIALTGIFVIAAAFALFGTATGTATNWTLLWIAYGTATLFMLPTVWTKPIASSFQRSLGVALAVGLSGSGVAAMIYPVLGTWLIGELGWRLAFLAMPVIWAALVFPIAFVCFRTPSQTVTSPTLSGEQPKAPAPASVLPGLTVPEALRSTAFYKLMAVCILFMMSILGVVVHFVPLLTELGASPLRAAATASLVGLSAIVGRISTGFLLDRLPGHLVGASVLLLPVLGTSLLLLYGSSTAVHYFAAVSIGFVLGGEVDVIAYLTTRYLGLRNFGVLFAAMGSALSLGTAVGPLIAGLVSDRWGTYAPFLVAALALSLLCSLALASLGRPRFAAGH